MANDQISKTLGISESTIGYYREKSIDLISNIPSNLLKQYLDEIQKIKIYSKNPFYNNLITSFGLNKYLF